ncbi:MAG: DUF2950 domain-containing protein, partial [Planctomycetota bacterium]|nr:DUF2950 domain-containing protein [Planctomycetota bacterium]
PEGGQGYHFIANMPLDAPPNCLQAWDAKGNHEKGRCALYHDSHVKFLKEDQFEEELANTINLLKERGIEPKILDPWLPPGVQPKKPGQKSGLNPFAQMESDPEAFMRELLATFQLYRLPPARAINKHLFGAMGIVRVLPEGILMENYGPLPLLTVANSSLIGGTTSVLTIPTIAAIVIPYLTISSPISAQPVELRVDLPANEARIRANETNAIACLRACAAAQTFYKKANYAANNGLKPRQYCPEVAGLAKHKNAAGQPIALITPPLAEAEEIPYNGYRFMAIKTKAGKALEYQDEFAFCAVPAEYGQSGVNTFFISTDGAVYMQDTKGEPLTDLPENPAAAGWVAAP